MIDDSHDKLSHFIQMIELCYTVYLGMCLNGVSKDILLLCADIILLPITIFELQIMEAHEYVMI